MDVALKESGQRYSGYAAPRHEGAGFDLASVGRGTPGGEYLRRFWHPVAFLDELKDVPLRARILGEDLVVFRDGGGDVGVLHLNCCHRGTSLEFGLIADKGIRCCYHGRVFDTDGSILEMPGELNADRLPIRCICLPGWRSPTWGRRTSSHHSPCSIVSIFPG